MVVKVVVVHGITGERMEIDLCDTEEQFKSITVLQLKEKIAERWGYQDFRGECLRLIFRDKSLVLDKDSSPLSAYGIQHMSHICALVHVPGGSFEPGKGDGGMGDKGGKKRNKEQLFSF